MTADTAGCSTTAPDDRRARQAAAALRYRTANRERLRVIGAERSRRYRAEQPAKATATVRASRAKNPGAYKAYLADYYERNKEEIKAATRAREVRLKIELRPANAERAMRRVARKRRASPSWADQSAILAFYELASRLTASTGEPHQVDHIVPLQSKHVCGLHVPANLRVIPRSANQSKSNRVWPDCPDHILERLPASLVLRFA